MMKKLNDYFEKQNEEPIEIEYIEHPGDYRTVGLFPAIWFENHYIFLEDFTRVHNNPWYVYVEFPDFIHGIQNNVYSQPLFIELVDDSHANVYYSIPC